MSIIDIHIFPDGRMDAKNAALYLGKAEKTLAMMRSQGKGPTFIKRGTIFYKKDDLDDWINQGAGFKSTAQARLKNN
jgi:hypothetical protein